MTSPRPNENIRPVGRPIAAHCHPFEACGADNSRAQESFPGVEIVAVVVDRSDEENALFVEEGESFAPDASAGSEKRAAVVALRRYWDWILVEQSVAVDHVA